MASGRIDLIAENDFYVYVMELKWMIMAVLMQLLIR